MSVKALRASPCIAAPLQSRGEFQQRLWMGLIHPSEAYFSDMSRARGWIHIHSPEGIPEQLQKSFPRLYQQWYTILAQHKEITCYLYSRVSSHKAVVTTQQKFPHWHAGILLTPKCTTESLYIHALALQLPAAISQLAPPSLRHSGKSSGQGLSREAQDKAVRPFTK